MLTPSESALAFVVGALLFVSGAVLIFVVWRQYLASEEEERPESLLAPVLAVDTLEPRLRVLWVKSMLVDAEATASEKERAARLSREIRRGLVALQAELVRRGDGERARAFYDEIVSSLNVTLDRQRDPGETPDYAERVAALQEMRTALDDVAEGR